MNKLVFVSVFLMMFAISNICLSQEKQQTVNTVYSKYTFQVYGAKKQDQAKKLESEYVSKRGIYFAHIDLIKKENIVICDSKIKQIDITEIARLLDLKLDNINQSLITQKEFETLSKSYSTVK